MRAFVTGATGFLGGALVRRLRGRGDDVVALVRDPARAGALTELGCELARGDLSDAGVLAAASKGSDSLFHVAAAYKVGITEEECRQMHEANVAGTKRVLDAAVEAGVGRIVYVSTVNYFGNTNGQIVDETYERPGDDWLSCYDHTKYLAHRAALKRAAGGAPIVVVQPGGIYGPGDHSEIGNMIDQLRSGRLKFLMFPELGFNLVYVDDAAEGILLAHDKGRAGEAYVLGGEISTMGKLLSKVGEIEGVKVPGRTMPAALMKAAIPIGSLIGKMMGFPPNLRELIRVSDGVTYWAKDDKARRELGYNPRDLDAGLRAMLAATP